MNTLQKIKDLRVQVNVLKERRDVTDSKIEDRNLQSQIDILEEEIEDLSSDLVEELRPKNISLSFKVEKKVNIEPDYWDFDPYLIAEHPEKYESKEDVYKAMMDEFLNNLDSYSYIDPEDIKIKYD